MIGKLVNDELFCLVFEICVKVRKSQIRLELKANMQL